MRGAAEKSAAVRPRSPILGIGFIQAHAHDDRMFSTEARGVISDLQAGDIAIAMMQQGVV